MSDENISCIQKGNIFWKIEAKVWKFLYQNQRGGKAFISIQKELASARAEISRLENIIKRDSDE